jgi:hypothetical protein
MKTSITSRRALLAGLALAPMIAAPGSLAGGSNPDADLLALAPEFDRLHQAVEAMRPEWQVADDAFEAARIAAGPRFHNRPDMTNEGFFRVWNELLDETGTREILDRYEKLHSELDKFSDRIGKAPPARTPEGIALRARLLGLNTYQAWEDEPDNLDWDVLLVRRVVEDACALVGLDRLGRPLAATSA